MPSDEGNRRVRHPIARVKADLGDLSAEEQVQIQEAVAVVRRSRSVMLGMPRIGQPLPDVRPGSTRMAHPSASPASPDRPGWTARSSTAPATCSP